MVKYQLFLFCLLRRYSFAFFRRIKLEAYIKGKRTGVRRGDAGPFNGRTSDSVIKAPISFCYKRLTEGAPDKLFRAYVLSTLLLLI